ncbi:conjugal transfer protein TraO [Pedobacter sp.]|uniref:conjugal transfer protein TraO n=1 Tax=Pedobacter sp. TaxID=1411316 RepID=UPI00396C67B7
MKRVMFYVTLAFMLVVNVAWAQRFEKGQLAIELRSGLANGYFFSKYQNSAYFAGLTANLYTGIDSKWVAGGEYYHKKYDYKDSSLKLAQFTGEVGHYFPLVFDCKQNLVISAGASALAGYERINWGRHLLYDKAILLNQDHFIYGGAATLEVEFFPSDKLIIFATGRERILFGSLDKFNGQVGIGTRFLIK